MVNTAASLPDAEEEEEEEEEDDDDDEEAKALDAEIVDAFSPSSTAEESNDDDPPSPLPMTRSQLLKMTE